MFVIRLFFLLIFLACSCAKLISNPNLDSLYGVWADVTKSDTARVLAYYNYLWDRYMFEDPDTLIRLTEELTEYSSQNDFEYARVRAKILRGNADRVLGKDSLAFDEFFKGIEIADRIGEYWGKSALLSGIGNTHYRLGQYDQMQEYLQKEIEIYEKLDHQKGIAHALVNKGEISRIQGDLDSAIAYLNRSLNIYNRIESGPVMRIFLSD